MSTWVTGTTVTENSTSVENNTSNVTIRLIVGWNYGSWAADNPAWYINVNGSRVASGTANFNTGQASSGSQQVASWTGNVPHNSDGTGSMSWSVGYEGIYAGEGNYSTASGTKTLTTINRYSIFGSVTDINIESSFSFPVTKYLSGATDTLVISSGSFSKTVSNYTSNTSISFTSSEKNSLYALNTTGTTIPLTLTLTTTYNSTNIGSDTKTINGTFTATAPTASGTPTNSPSTVYTGYTDVTVSINGMTFTGTKAATIVTYKVTLGNVTKTSTSKSTSFVFERATSGSLSVDVVDSRGNSLATPVTKSITVVNYTAPTIANFSVYRSPNPTSTSLKLDISGTYTNNSTILSGTKLTVKYRLKGSTGSWTNVYNNVALSSITGMTASGGNYSLSGASVSGTFGMTNAYDFEAILNDTNTSVTVTVDISVLTASTTLDIDTNTRRVGIGLFCSTEDDESLSVAGDIYEGGTKLANKYAGYTVVSSSTVPSIALAGSSITTTGNANIGGDIYEKNQKLESKYVIQPTQYVSDLTWTDWQNTKYENLTVSGSGVVFVSISTKCASNNDTGTATARIELNNVIVAEECNRLTSAATLQIAANASAMFIVSNGDVIKTSLYNSKGGTAQGWRRAVAFGCTLTSS